MKIDDTQFSKIIDAINGISKVRAYDLDILDAALFSSFVSVLAVVFTVIIFLRQKTLMQQQNTTIQAQAEIAQKQVQIMSQQSNIALLGYRLKVFSTVNKVLTYLIDDKFKENFILCSLNQNAFSQKMENYTHLRDEFIEEAYNSSVVLDDDVAKTLIYASKKFNQLIVLSLEMIFMMQVDSYNTSAEEQEQNKESFKKFILNKNLNFEDLPQDLKNSFQIDHITELTKELYGILSDEGLHQKINRYIDAHKVE